MCCYPSLGSRNSIGCPGTGQRSSRRALLCAELSTAGEHGRAVVIELRSLLLECFWRGEGAQGDDAAAGGGGC